VNCTGGRTARCVVRAPNVYLIPRGDGRVTVGARSSTWALMICDDGRDLGPGADRTKNCFGSEVAATNQVLGGLRPRTPDGLPVMGPALDSRSENKPPRCWHATGHYRGWHSARARDRPRMAADSYRRPHGHRARCICSRRDLRPRCRRLRQERRSPIPEQTRTTHAKFGFDLSNASCPHDLDSLE